MYEGYLDRGGMVLKEQLRIARANAETLTAGGQDAWDARYWEGRADALVELASECGLTVDPWKPRPDTRAPLVDALREIVPSRKVIARALGASR
jgi:hypothetical protein